MSVRVTVHLADVAEQQRLTRLASMLGYTREVAGSRVVNLSAFVRGIANGELVVTKAPVRIPREGG